jgi:hypothetical protein
MGFLFTGKLFAESNNSVIIVYVSYIALANVPIRL